MVIPKCSGAHTSSMLEQVRHASTGLPQSTNARRRRGLKKIGKRLVNPFWGVEQESEDEIEAEERELTMHGRLKVKKSMIEVIDSSDDDVDDDDDHDNGENRIRRTQKHASYFAPQYRLEAISVSNSDVVNCS